jgi:hypothetical protein
MAAQAAVGTAKIEPLAAATDAAASISRLLGVLEDALIQPVQDAEAKLRQGDFATISSN